MILYANDKKCTIRIHTVNRFVELLQFNANTGKRNKPKTILLPLSN